MIMKRRFFALPLLTALIITLVSANLNVAYIGATDGSSDTGNPGTTMTFNSDVTMDFGSDKYTWLTNGSLIHFKNITGGNITAMRPGLEFTAKVDPGMGFGAPLPGHWYYVYAPKDLYGMYIAFTVDAVWGPAGTPSFNVSQVWDHFYDVPRNFTIFPPVEPPPAGNYVEAEHMVDPLTVCYDYYVVSGEPTDDSWWEIDYPGDWVGSRFHVDDAYLVAGVFLYAHIDTLLNATGANVTNIPADPIPNEGFGAFELIETIETGTEYYIFSPTSLLPETGTWWNITYPTELSDMQFNISYSYDWAGYKYFSIDTLWNTTAAAPVGSITIAPDYAISAILATAPTVSRIGSWYNVIEGSTPDSPSCWNITAPETLAGVTFFVDMSGKGVFHIDEVLNATGQPGPVTVEPPVANVTAEQFTPKIYVEASPYAEGYPDWYWNFTVSIKTDYIFHVWSYEFTLTWNPSLLECIEVNNGDLISGGTATFQAGNIDNINGELDPTGAYFSYTDPDPAPQTHGTLATRTLATVKFTANLTGVDLGIYGITFGSDETRLIGVTQDGYGEKYTAIDDIITGEVVDGQVKVKIPGDIDADGDVDPFDFNSFRLAYASKAPPQVPEPYPNYNCQADFDLDGDVDPFDFNTFRLNYAKKTTDP